MILKYFWFIWLVHLWKKKVVTDDHWKKFPFQDEEKTDAQKVPTRRWGSGKRSRPRPLSDYGQLAIRSFSIPEDSVAMDSQEMDSLENDSEIKPPPVKSGTCAVANPKALRRRPISVIGAVSYYENNQTEEITALLAQVRNKIHSLKKLNQKIILLFFPVTFNIVDTPIPSFCFFQIITT